MSHKVPRGIHRYTGKRKEFVCQGCGNGTHPDELMRVRGKRVCMKCVEREIDWWRFDENHKLPCEE